MVVPSFITSTQITPLMSQKTATITSPDEGALLKFLHGNSSDLIPWTAVLLLVQNGKSMSHPS